MRKKIIAFCCGAFILLYGLRMTWIAAFNVLECVRGIELFSLMADSDAATQSMLVASYVETVVFTLLSGISAFLCIRASLVRKSWKYLLAVFILDAARIIVQFLFAICMFGTYALQGLSFRPSYLLPLFILAIALYCRLSKDPASAYSPILAPIIDKCKNVIGGSNTSGGVKDSLRAAFSRCGAALRKYKDHKRMD